MPRDYKNHARSNGGGQSRRKSTRKKKQQTPGWVWFLAGLLISGSAFGLYLYMEKQSKPVKKTRVVEQQPPRQQKKKTAPPKQEEKPRHPQFEFYSVLPEMEVEVPPDTLRPSVRQTPTSKTGIATASPAAVVSSACQMPPDKSAGSTF